MTARTGRKAVAQSILRGLRQARAHARSQAKKFWRIVEARASGLWSPGLKSEVTLSQCITQARRLRSPLVIVRRGRAIALLYALEGKGGDIVRALTETRPKKKTREAKT